MYRRRRAAGLCVRCGKNAKGKMLCREHALNHATYLRNRYARMAEALRTLEEGKGEA
jgi:hypothetical protein